MFFLAKALRDRRLLKSTTSEGLKRRLMTTVCGLAILSGAHISAMQTFEDLSFSDAAWVTAATATTVGYGDVSAKTPEGRFSTGLIMFGGGIFTLTQFFAIASEMSQLRKEKILTGKRKWNMKDHIVIVNSPKNDPEAYFKKLMTDLRKSSLHKAQLPAVIVSPHMETISDDLRKLSVAHVNESLADQAAFEKASAENASVIVILSHDENDPTSDSVTLDLVERARRANPQAQIIAEAILDENKERMIRNGANNVIRPIRAYPEMLVRTVLTPGAEKIIHDVFDAGGDECVRYDVSIKGKWAEVASRAIMSDVGLPMGFVDMNDNTVVSVNPGSHIEGKAIFALVRDGNIKPTAEVAKALSSERTTAAPMPAAKGASGRHRKLG